MTVDLLTQLEGVKQTGPEQWTAKCPGADHKDRHASLSVSIGRDGQWLLHCHVGCPLEAIVAGVGIDVRDLFVSNGEPELRPHDSFNGKALARALRRDVDPLPDDDTLDSWVSALAHNPQALAAIHRAKGWRADVLAAIGVGLKGDRYSIPVRSLDGELVQLLTYRPNGKPKMLALKGHPRAPLYALVDDEGPVFYCEGEPDAVSLAHVGVNAIGLPGAGKAVDERWLEPLRGRDVVVFADDDEPGRSWARQCATLAHGLASETCLVELHGEPKGYDIGDLLLEHRDDADHGRAALLELVESAPPWSPLSQRADPPSDPLTGPPNDASVERIARALFVDTENTRDGNTLVREPVPGSGGLLWRGVAHTLFGERGEGKSIATLITTMAAAVAGERVLYLDRENGSALMRSLVESVLDAHEDWPDVLESGQWEGRHYPTLDGGWEPADYARAIADRGYTGVVYDSVREALAELGGDPNAEQDYSRLMRLLVTSLTVRGLWVVLLDNVGHVEKGRPKGSGAKLDAVPIAYQVRTVTEFNAVTEGEVELKCTRSRYGDTGREWGLTVGGGRYDVPEPREESPDERAAREAAERFERFHRGVVEELRHGSLGRKQLLKRVGGARATTLRQWLDRLVDDPSRGVVHDEESGYSLGESRHGGPGEGPLPGGTPRDTGDADPPTDDHVDELVEYVKREFDADEVDEHGEPIGGG